jgi:hypothetical protein
MFQCAILVFKFDEFLFVPLENVYLVLEVADDDILLV